MGLKMGLMDANLHFCDKKPQNFLEVSNNCHTFALANQQDLHALEW
jgi:hypothetical protein